jgi:uncharacterized phosphosugar-binding protein
MEALKAPNPRPHRPPRRGISRGRTPQLPVAAWASSRKNRAQRGRDPLQLGKPLEAAWRDGVNQPDAVRGAIEAVAVPLHGLGVDAEDNGGTATSADPAGRLYVGREVDVMPGHLLQTVALDQVGGAGRSAVVEVRRRGLGGELEVDVDAVALVRTDPLAGFVEGKALLIVVGDDLLQLLAGERETARAARFEERGHGDPAAWLQHEAEGFRLVPEVPGEELALADEIAVVQRRSQPGMPYPASPGIGVELPELGSFRPQPLPTMSTPAAQYLTAACEILERVERTQMEAIRECGRRCGEAILAGGLVHMFGSGHSRMALEEMFPRYGSFPGFHTIVELSVTFHNQVVGANGQRQAMFIERTEGLGPVILRNFELGPHDLMWVVSTSGTGALVVDVALEAKRRGLPVIALVSVEHAAVSKPGHSSGKKLTEIADLVLDNCAVAGDAMVRVEGLKYPVGPGSTIGNTAIINSVKCEVARILTEGGQPPYVLTHAHYVGEEESREVFERAYDDYRRRVRRL